MKKWSVILLITILAFGFKRMTRTVNDPIEIKSAIVKSLPLLLSSSHVFLENAGGCHSCHGQGLGGVVFSLAKEKGFAVNDTLVKEAISSITDTWQNRASYLAQNEDPAAIVIGGGYDLWALSRTGIKTNKSLELLARNILQRQRGDGGWVTPSQRPPIEYYAFTATALAVKSIQSYLPAILQDEVKNKIEKAKSWLINHPAIANEEKAFQLLGLAWTKADTGLIKQTAKKLIASQHADGGWSQLSSLPTDAYATGQALYALHQSGCLPVSSAVYQKGIAFLLRTQLADGSWKIITRSFPSVDYVYSGFPHDDHQFISAAGSNWATLALLLAMN